MPFQPLQATDALLHAIQSPGLDHWSRQLPPALVLLGALRHVPGPPENRRIGASAEKWVKSNIQHPKTTGFWMILDVFSQKCGDFWIFSPNNYISVSLGPTTLANEPPTQQMAAQWLEIGRGPTVIFNKEGHVLGFELLNLYQKVLGSEQKCLTKWLNHRVFHACGWNCKLAKFMWQSCKAPRSLLLVSPWLNQWEFHFNFICQAECCDIFSILNLQHRVWFCAFAVPLRLAQGTCVKLVHIKSTYLNILY